jgi:hypothetical protein
MAPRKEVTEGPWRSSWILPCAAQWLVWPRNVKPLGDADWLPSPKERRVIDHSLPAITTVLNCTIQRQKLKPIKPRL